LKPLLILLATLVVGPAHAAGPLLEVPVWTEIEPLVGAVEDRPPEQAIPVDLLEQARLILGGMIYGYSFVYTPSDRGRKVADRFDLIPLGEIPWGDPRLSVAWVTQKQGRLYAQMAYDMAEFQDARRRAWSTSSLPAASGRGEEQLASPHARQAALKAAIEEAIRDYARGRVDNKPRELRGDVVIWEPHTTMMGRGTYLTTVKVKLRITDTLPYRLY
jgi:hypothetical protein